jgi:hypothetical protein
MQPEKRKEAIVLLAVAVIGVGGLLLLQKIRTGGGLFNEDRTLVQQQGTDGNASQAAQSNLQAIPGDLLRVNEDPEAGKPFLFELGDFSAGAVYELDPGDGGARRAFEQGKLTYTYQSDGDFTVRIYARYQGTEALIRTVVKNVTQRKVEKLVNQRSGKPIIDD